VAIAKAIEVLERKAAKERQREAGKTHGKGQKGKGYGNLPEAMVARETVTKWEAAEWKTKREPNGTRTNMFPSIPDTR
jgi:hypothetical protein